MAVAHRVDHLDEPVLVVVADLEQALAVADVALLVRGERLDGVVVGEPLQRAEVVAERVGLGLRVRLTFGVMRGSTQSPVSISRLPASQKQRWPGEWPGVHSAVRSHPGMSGGRRPP